MSDTTDTKLRRQRPASNAYVLGWVAMATVALGYMTLVATKPELAAQYTPSLKSLETHAADEAPEPQSSDDARSLRQALAQAQLDAARARTELKVETERTNTLSSRLTALEPKPASEAAPETGAQPAAPEKASQTAAAQPEAPPQQAAAASEPAPQIKVRRIAVIDESEPAEKVSPPAPAGAQPAAARGPVNEASPTHSAASDLADTMASEPATRSAKAAAAIETGSISAPAPVSFGRAIVKPAPQPARQVGLKIANSTSVDALRLTWGLLNERHGEALKRLNPRYVNGGSMASPSYDLIAGPVKNAAEARRMCNSLAARGISCSVGSYEGNAL